MDNNPSERSLSHLLISRKVNGGTRSDQGAESKMTLASLFGAWRSQGLNPLAACRQLLTSPQLWTVTIVSTMTTIIGIDYSGSREDRNTWVTQGHLDADGTLVFDWAHPACRDDLYALLSTTPVPAVAALDFPFGVPAAFANFLNPGNPPIEMPDVWRVVAGCDLDRFVVARNEFVANHGEPRRAGDVVYFPESFSPLHNVNPNMVPMTCRGIQMLQRLHMDIPNRWLVPPLGPVVAPADAVTLLELMPGAFLRSVGLPFRGYKKGRRALELRTVICDGLAAATGLRLANLDILRMACRANDDCLDSVVAAVGAATWALDANRFRHPTANELANACLEGWIFVLQPAN